MLRRDPLIPHLMSPVLRDNKPVSARLTQTISSPGACCPTLNQAIQILRAASMRRLLYALVSFDGRRAYRSIRPRSPPNKADVNQTGEPYCLERTPVSRRYRFLQTYYMSNIRNVETSMADVPRIKKVARHFRIGIDVATGRVTAKVAATTECADEDLTRQ